MRGFEPRSRHHDNGACLPPTPHWESCCCYTPETVPYSGSLNRSQLYYNDICNRVVDNRERSPPIFYNPWIGRLTFWISYVNTSARPISAWAPPRHSVKVSNSMAVLQTPFTTAIGQSVSDFQIQYTLYPVSWHHQYYENAGNIPSEISTLPTQGWVSIAYEAIMQSPQVAILYVSG